MLLTSIGRDEVVVFLLYFDYLFFGFTVEMMSGTRGWIQSEETVRIPAMTDVRCPSRKRRYDGVLLTQLRLHRPKHQSPHYQQQRRHYRPTTVVVEFLD